MLLFDRLLARVAEHIVLAAFRRERAFVLTASEYAAYRETAEILEDPDALAAIDEGEDDIARGQLRDYAEYRQGRHSQG